MNITFLFMYIRVEFNYILHVTYVLLIQPVGCYYEYIQVRKAPQDIPYHFFTSKKKKYLSYHITLFIKIVLM